MKVRSLLCHRILDQCKITRGGLQRTLHHSCDRETMEGQRKRMLYRSGDVVLTQGSGMFRREGPKEVLENVIRRVAENNCGLSGEQQEEEGAGQ